MMELKYRYFIRAFVLVGAGIVGVSCAEGGDEIATGWEGPGKVGAQGGGAGTQIVEVPAGGNAGTGGNANGGSGGIVPGSGGSGGFAAGGSGGFAAGGSGGFAAGGTGGFAAGGTGGFAAGGTGGGGPAECAPGETESKNCGACDTGKRTRACTSGKWGSWGSCVGENTGFPRNPKTDAVVCPPYNRPAVYFTPHPFSESVGMAGSITKHVGSAHVFIEVMSHGEKSRIRDVLNDGNTCTFHNGAHNYNLTEEEFGNARVREFKDAAGRLNVNGIYVGNCKDTAITRGDVEKRIKWWMSIHTGEGLRLKGVSGSNDPKTADGTSYNSDHVAIWEALMASGHGDIRGYLVMHYNTGAGKNFSTEDIKDQLPQKRNALGAYKDWNPSAGRYAIGYHSSSTLWDSAYNRTEEYVVRP